MNRKTFLKIATTVAAAAPVAAMLQGCSAGHVVYATVQGKKVVLPLASLPDLGEPNSFAKVYVRELANPILLFEGEEKNLHAILSTCSHSGCEVRKLRTKFECPCHGSEYDLRGNVMRGPAPDPLESFEVRRDAGAIEIRIG